MCRSGSLKTPSAAARAGRDRRGDACRAAAGDEHFGPHLHGKRPRIRDTAGSRAFRRTDSGKRRGAKGQRRRFHEITSVHGPIIPNRTHAPQPVNTCFREQAEKSTQKSGYGKRTSEPNEDGVHDSRPRPHAAAPRAAPESVSVSLSERPRRWPGCGRIPPASRHGMRNS